MTKVVGITGNSGTGKTLIMQRFAERGAAVVNADVVARELMIPGAPLYEPVVKEFGQDYVLPDGAIDRKKLAALVFSDEEKRKRLNHLTHPVIVEQIERFIRREKDKKTAVVVVEAALLIESGLEPQVDKLLVVVAPPELKKSRIMARDGLTLEEAANRLLYQGSDQDIMGYASEVIYNDGSLNCLYRAVDAFYDSLLDD